MNACRLSDLMGAGIGFDVCKSATCPSPVCPSPIDNLNACRLSDLVGADIGFHVGKNFIEEKPDQFYPAAVFKLMVDNNILGEKTSGGFYTFEKNK